MKKIVITISSTIILFSVLFSFQVAAASFDFTPKNKTIPQNCEDELIVKINTKGEYSNAADIEIQYDPTKVMIIDSWPLLPGTQVAIGDAYESYVYNDVNTTLGIIKVAAGSIFTQFHGDKTFIIIKFKSIPPATYGDFTINFSGVGNTLDSNIAQTTTSLDLLTSVTNGHYTFQNKECKKNVAAPNIKITKPISNIFKGKVEFELELTDIDDGVDINTFQMIVDGILYESNSFTLTYTGNQNKYIVSLDPNITLENYDLTVFTFIVKDFSQLTGTAIMVLNGIDTLPETGVECATDNTYVNIVNSINSISGSVSSSQAIALTLALAGFISIASIIGSFGYLVLFFVPYRRRKKYWGVVFDKETMLPVPFTIIELRDSKTNKLIAKTEADIAGRYGLIAEPGDYIIISKHSNYDFYSLSTQVNIYKGQIFKIEKEHPIYFDIALIKNQNTKTPLKYKLKLCVVKFNKFFQKAYPYLLFAILFQNIIFYLISKDSIYLILIAYHVSLIVFHFFLINHYSKKWGYCFDSSTTYRIGESLIKVINPKDGNLIDCKISDMNGRFKFILPKGKWQIIINANYYSFPSIIDKKFQKETGKVIIDSSDKFLYYDIPLDQIKPIQAIQPQL